MLVCRIELADPVDRNQAGRAYHKIEKVPAAGCIAKEIQHGIKDHNALEEFAEFFQAIGWKLREGMLNAIQET